MWKEIWSGVKANCRRVLELEGSPHEVAGGVAIGIFFGFTPFFGLKTLLSLIVAVVLGYNPIAAIVAVSLHDIITPAWPVILRMQYDIGYWILSSPHVFPPHLHVTHLHLHELLNWDTFVKIGWPLCVGSLFFSIPSAVVFYFITWWLVEEWRRRRGRRRDGEMGGRGDGEKRSK